MCFTKRPGVILPDRAKVLSNLSNGGSGRAVAEAILDGRIDDARTMLIRDPRLLTTIVTHDPRMDRFPDGQFGDLLTLAVARCDPKIVSLLLDAGMSPNGQLPGQALGLAILADTPDIAEQLLRAGAAADPEPVSNANDPMNTAMTFSHVGAVMMLLRHGANPRLTGKFGNDRVSDAVAGEATDIAELLVDHGGSLFTVADDGSMAIHTLMRPPIMADNAARNAARKRLIAKAKSSGMPWPPPPRETVKQMVLSGLWPTAQMAKAGMIVPPAALERMRAH